MARRPRGGGEAGAQARLLLLFGLDPPRAGERQPAERAARAAPEPEEEDSYAALVKELGY